MQIKQGYSFTRKKDLSLSINNKNESSNVNIIVKSINIIGKTKYDSEFISDLSGIHSGDLIDSYNVKVDSAIKKLWDSHLFQNISIYKKDVSKNEIDLFFELEDLVEIHEVKVEGIKKEQLKNIKKIKPGDKISEDIIQDIKNEIQEYYTQKGYDEINIKSEINKVENKNVLYLSVDKGKKIEIKKILFEGNNIISDKELLDLMTKTKKNFYVPIIDENIFLFVKENIKHDLKNISDKYKSMGFIDVQVFLDSIWKDEFGNYIIKIKITEGDQYYLGNVYISGNNRLLDKDIKRIFSHKKGDIYNKTEIDKYVSSSSFPKSILSTYLDLGYLFINAIPIEKKVSDNKIDLEIKIKENNPVYIRKVDISGNIITKDHVIRRELKTYPGDLISLKNLKDSLSNLEKLNLFSKVYYEIKPAQESNFVVDIEWHVVERNTTELQINGGFEGKDIKKIIGNFQLSFGNFSLNNILEWRLWNPIPQGDGQKLVISSKFGKDFSSYGFSFMNPWVEKIHPTSLTLSGNYLTKNSEIEKDEYSYVIIKSCIGYDGKDRDLCLQGKEYRREEGFGERTYSGRKDFSINVNKLLTFLDPYSSISTSINYENSQLERDIFIINDPSDHDTQEYQLNNLNALISLQRKSIEPDIIFPFQGSIIRLDGKFTPEYSHIFPNKNYYRIHQIDWVEYFKLKMFFSWYKKIFGRTVLKVGCEGGFMGKYKNSKKDLLSFYKFYMGGVKNNFFGSNLENKDFIPLRGYSYGEENFKYPSPVDGGIIYNKFVLELRNLIKNTQDLKIWNTLFMEGGNISDSYEKFNLLKMNKSLGFGFRIFWKKLGFFGIDFGYPIDDIVNNKTESKWKKHFIFGKNL
ncbi:BamA/OMP85 family outer membrane protein [Blattabacterium cuenoti]|uniref:BamA/OMP85 family outer membrane protein n=1 Tax=Blattabacterium cuenoti TaxID=1653831 RepID=UPI001EEA2A13|nr:POTRA domain-containing protein [Blattabacterium cuenoti]